ncbi:hypothetical protein [Terasakiella sp. SH-1]|uniref:hypothetical protein n=1 Tax=Terasakiella sp. SH-1 TaxID=2560057 RepID=UPI00107458B3|nr:hypothetical protein [Terasakiella sp. SH-1]
MKQNDDHMYFFTGFEHGLAYYLMEGWPRRAAALEVAKNLKLNSGIVLANEEAFKQARKALVNEEYIKWVSGLIRDHLALQHSGSDIDDLERTCRLISQSMRGFRKEIQEVEHGLLIEENSHEKEECQKIQKELIASYKKELWRYNLCRVRRRQIRLLIPEDRIFLKLSQVQFLSAHPSNRPQ